MLCPVCGTPKDNPTWETCRSRACGDIYRKSGKVKIVDINIKDIVDKLRSNRMKIHNLQKDIQRLIYIQKLYDTTKNKRKAY